MGNFEVAMHTLLFAVGALVALYLIAWISMRLIFPKPTA
jgi:phage shock protein PspC (stress-responsive transcriptional regulator)